jgi:hypothetical protein
MSSKVYDQAVKESEAPVVPKRDATRISIIPKKTLSEAELTLFLKKVHADVEKSIPPGERSEGLKNL